MKRITIGGLCLVAAVVTSAFAASIASAATPIYTVCKKVAAGTGEFANKICTEAGGKEDYEFGAWNEGKKTSFTGKSGKSVLDVYIPGAGIVGDTECQKAKEAGSLTGAATAATVVTFEKCASSGKTCTSTNTAKKGDIVTFTLDEELVAIPGGSGVGQEVKGAGPGGKLAEFDCEGEELSVAGAVVGEVTEDIGVFSKSSSTAFATNAGGEPTIQASEPLLTTIVGVGVLPSGETAAASLKGEAVEIHNGTVGGLGLIITRVSGGSGLAEPKTCHWIFNTEKPLLGPPPLVCKVVLYLSENIQNGLRGTITEEEVSGEHFALKKPCKGAKLGKAKTAEEAGRWAEKCEAEIEITGGTAGKEYEENSNDVWAGKYEAVATAGTGVGGVKDTEKFALLVTEGVV